MNVTYMTERGRERELQQCQLSHVSQSVWEASNELIVRQKPIEERKNQTIC